MSPCIACGKPTKERSKLCSRVKCVQARGLRRAQAVAGMNEKIKNAKPATEQEPRPKHIIEAETSAGTRVAKTKNEIDADDLRDVADRSKPAKRTPVDERPKQPAYLKSVAQPVVYNPANKEAPFGYDDNDRPIGVPVGKPYVKPELKAIQDSKVIQERPSNGLPCGGCGNDLCKHCHPENAVRTDVLRSLTERPPQKPIDLEENFRRQLGIAERPSFRIATSTKKRPFDYFPEILGITRGQLVQLFDEVVDTEVETVRLMETRLKSTEPIQHQIINLRKTIEHAKKRLQCIPLLVQRSERLILSWSAQVMKYGTKTIPPRAPEDILDEKTREKFKYEELKKLKKYELWKTRLQKMVRESQGQIDQLQQRLDNWGSHPSDLENVTITRDREITFKDKFREPEQPINDLSDSYAKLRELGATKTEAYISLLSTDYQMLADELSWSHPLLRPWRWFENEIVLQAIGFKLIRLTAKALELYPQLTKYLDASAWSEDDIEIDDSDLHRSILKTGGAEVGAFILNFGLTRKGQPRMSGSFDNAIAYGKRRGTAAPEQDSSGGFAGEIDSGDYAEDIATE